MDERGGKQRDKATDIPPRRRRDQRQERHEATGSGAETKTEEEAENEEEGDRDRETPRGALVEVVCVGGYVPPPEENMDLSDFALDCAHLLLQEVYGDFPHHNDGLHLDWRVVDDGVGAV